MIIGTTRRVLVVPRHLRKTGLAKRHCRPSDPIVTSADQRSLDYADSYDPLNCPEGIDGHRGARIPERMPPDINQHEQPQMRERV